MEIYTISSYKVSTSTSIQKERSLISSINILFFVRSNPQLEKSETEDKFPIDIYMQGQQKWPCTFYKLFYENWLRIERYIKTIWKSYLSETIPATNLEQHAININIIIQLGFFFCSAFYKRSKT